MNPAWSVILFTVLAGAGQGLFLALFSADLAGLAPARFVVEGSAVALVLLGSGLVASFFHLGHPARAWRAVAMWRTSWLSREVIVLPAFTGLVFLYGILSSKGLGSEASIVGWIGVALCIALFVCTGMIYACLPFLQEWRSPLTLANFLALGCASGLTAAAALAAWRHPPLVAAYVTGAIVVGVVAYLIRIGMLARNARLRPKSTLASATGIQGKRVVQIAQGSTGGSFNTREFFHGRTRGVVKAVRWGFLALVFPVPAALLLNLPHTAGPLVAALGLQAAGLLAERWYFFAEARHPQNLYYQAIA
ncbi:MAG TPA: DmsC/YnfH family molybdoenzyme membrane anchor subunit [Burkholderiales bacterium]|jgi:DMSO reductase anchor subunit